MDSLILLALLLPLAALLLFNRYLRLPEEESVDLSRCTVKELRALAKERGLKGVSRLKKADLIKRLQQ